MAIQQRKDSSILLTFKVLQFVNYLRRRVKPRNGNNPSIKSRSGTDASHRHLGLRTITADTLSRITTRKRKSSRHATNRVNKIRNTNANWSAVSPYSRSFGTAAAGSLNTCGDDVTHMLKSVDEKLSPSGNSFSTIAGDDQLFLKHMSSPSFEGYSLNQTVQLLFTIQHAITVLHESRSKYSDEFLLAQGLESGVVMDENFIANFEHMLDRLRAEIIEALGRKVLEELLRGDHDKNQRKLLSWFTEFAGVARPLSMSFPWTIKPSLAVLWGVCWMFYPGSPSEAPGSSSNRVRQNRVLQQIDNSLWSAPASSDYLTLGRALIGDIVAPQQNAQQQPTAQMRNAGLANEALQARNTDDWESDLNSLWDDAVNSSLSRLPTRNVSQAGADEPLHVAPSRNGAPLPGQGTYYPRAQPPLPVVPHQVSFLPQFQGSQELAVYSHLGSDLTWNPYDSLPQQSPRHPLGTGQNQNNPSIRLTPATARNQGFTQPQHFAAHPNIYPQYSRQPQAPQLNTSNIFLNYSNMSTSPISPTAQVLNFPSMIKHERSTSIQSNSIPTPITNPERSPLPSPTAGERHQMRSPHSHDRRDSVNPSEHGVDEDGTLRKNYTFKRAEEPPRNSEGKLMCNHQDCAGIVFDRKCEWSKHMDKHDRPYKCREKGCEKLQGFTYSGGLLRHEREVHKMHGGTKQPLFCPFNDCKRSSGSGFTRKENLAEHIRRVHRRTSMSADMHGLIIRRGEPVSPIVESRTSESPYERNMEYRDDDEMSLKRKRRSDSGLSDDANEEMRSEIKRLRQENEEKDSRLRQLEQAVMALQKSHR